MLDESSFDFSSSLTSELRFCRLHATRMHPFTSPPPLPQQSQRGQ